MPIRFLCPSCGTVCQVLDQFANQKVRCTCGALLLAPVAAGKAVPRPGKAAPRAKVPAKTAASGAPIVRRPATPAMRRHAVRASMSMVIAGMLLALTAVAAFLWTRQSQQNPAAPADQVIVANAPVPAVPTMLDTKASLTNPTARPADQPVASTIVQEVPKEPSPSPVVPPSTQPATRAAPQPIADKTPPPTSESRVAKHPAPATEIKPKADVQAPELPSRPVDTAKKTTSDAAPVKPPSPPTPAKSEAETGPAKAPSPSPPASAKSPTKPMADPMPVAGGPPAALASERLRVIDEHALAAPPEAEESVPTLAAYLIKPARNDAEKVRGIYRWITDRIAYDIDSFLRKEPPDSSAEGVLKRRLAVCEGYSTLFAALCAQARIEAVKVRGHGKGFGYQPGQRSDDLNHTWNAVKLKGDWHLMDVTWAAGYVNGTKFVKSRDDFYYLTPPDQFMFGHLPREPRWQLSASPVTFEAWDALPKVDHLLFSVGFSTKEIRKTIQQKGFRGLVRIHKPGGLPFVIRQAPPDGHLAAGSTLRVRVESTHFLKMAIVNEGKWHYLTKGPDGFTGEMTVQKGTVQVSALLPDKGDSYWGILEYVVEEKTTSARGDWPETRTRDSTVLAQALPSSAALVAHQRAKPPDNPGQIVLGTHHGLFRSRIPVATIADDF